MPSVDSFRNSLESRCTAASGLLATVDQNHHKLTSWVFSHRKQQIRQLENEQRHGIVARGQVLRSLSSLSRLGDVEGCAQVAKIMVGHVRGDRTTLNHILVACAKSGDVKVAEEVFLAYTQANIRPNRTTFCAIVRASVNALDPVKTELWLNHLFAQGYRTPPRFLRCLLGDLNQSLVVAASSLALPLRRDLLRLMDSWLVWLVALRVPVDRPSRKLLLGHFTKQFWEFDVQFSRAADICIVCCVLAARSDAAGVSRSKNRDGKTLDGSDENKLIVDTVCCHGGGQGEVSALT